MQICIEIGSFFFEVGL